MKIQHQVAILASVERVYEAIAVPEKIGTWWDKQVVKKTSDGLVLEHSPGETHGVVQLQVLRTEKDRVVEWECISSHPPTSPASVWTGTHFIFEITQADSPASTAVRACPDIEVDEICTLNFTQTNYDESSPYLGFNNFAWGLVLAGLKSVCESED